MSEAPLVKYVTAYITRGDRRRRELLAIKRPGVGNLVPFGDVVGFESPEAAVLRVARGQTGLTELAVIALLDVVSAWLTPNSRKMTEVSPLYAEPDPAAATLPIPMPDGESSLLIQHLPIELLEETDNWAKVRCQAVDVGVGMLVNVRQQDGWVPRGSYTSDVHRELFHLRATGVTPGRWNVAGPNGDDELFWIPLSKPAGLVDFQEMMLNRVKERLAQ